MVPFRTLHLWNSVCLCAQVVQVNTEWDSTLARRRYRGERRQIDEHIGCARAALHERPFCAHPNACDTQTHSLSAAPPLSGFTCLPAFALVCPLASGCDRLLQYFCLRACPSAPLNVARSGLNALDRVCLNLFCLACLPDLSAFERLLANKLSRVWLWHMHTASSAQHTHTHTHTRAHTHTHTGAQA